MPIERVTSRALIGATSLLVLAGCAPKLHYALMPDDQAPLVVEQCSRPNPPHYQSTWKLTPDDVRQLEADLPKLNALGPAGGGAHPGDADAYVRQYFGLVVKDRRVVYINGFLEPMANKDWNSYAMVICDGGNSAWGVLYDTADHRFYDLNFNGSP